ncbi:MAG: hypothetical protein ABW352_03825 [Polyangiales bacterium]
MHVRCALALSLLITSCSDDNTPVEPEEVVDARLDSGAVTMPKDAGVKRDAELTRVDSGRKPPTIPMQCEPGRYAGEFFCAISGIAPWFGKMEFDLVENVMGSGEFTTLSVAAGTQISSDLDSMGGTFSGDLVAEFDCRTGEIKGELANGIYLLVGVMPWRFNGPLQGSYGTDDAGLPAFEGKLGTLTTPDLWFYGPLGPSAMCDWHASRVDRVDAGP